MLKKQPRKGEDVTSDDSIFSDKAWLAEGKQQQAIKQAHLEQRTNATWKPGDTGLLKEIAGGHILIGSEAAALIGLEVGTDGWDEFRVADDPIEEGPGG